MRILSPSLRGWAAWDRRQPVEPALAGAGKEPVARKLADETRLLIALSARQLDGKAARLLIEAMRPPADTRIAAASLIAGRGDEATARALLADPLVLASRKTLGAKPQVPPQYLRAVL